MIRAVLVTSVVWKQNGNNLDIGWKSGNIWRMNQMDFELTKNKPDEEQDQPIVWQKWYEGVNEEGSFSINADRMTFKNEEQPVFFIVDEENNVGTSVFASHHPKATFTDATPHGIRLANAIGRAFDLDGTVSGSDLCQVVNDNEKVVVKVEKTKKGILWTVLVEPSK